jgi:hypothetical protein
MESATEEAARRQRSARFVRWGLCAVTAAAIYVASVGPVMAVRSRVWGRVEPGWATAVIDSLYAPHRWASENIPGAHGLIDRYIQWWAARMGA